MSSMHIVTKIFWFCGILKMLELLLRLFWFARRQLRTTDHLPARYGRGSWVVITGGSEGIGLAMAKELARLGFNLVLIAKKVELLNKAK